MATDVKRANATVVLMSLVGAANSPFGTLINRHGRTAPPVGNEDKQKDGSQEGNPLEIPFSDLRLCKIPNKLGNVFG